MQPNIPYIERYQDQYEMLRLIEPSTNSSVTLCPERGGIVISHIAHGQELLYLDKETLYDPKANIRGGIPVLFPISGQLTDGVYTWEGQAYSMKNHGVARTSAWEVLRIEEKDGASVTLSLKSTPATLEAFPFGFELEFTYLLKGGALHIEQRYRNHSRSAMPMYPGFHPYFKADRKDIAYDTDATVYHDYKDLQDKPFTGTIDLENRNESVAFLDAQRTRLSFQPSNYTVELSYSESFRYVVLWSVAGKPFVCVEPWMALTGEMNRQESLVMVQPGETLEAELIIRKG